MPPTPEPGRPEWPVPIEPLPIESPSFEPLPLEPLPVEPPLEPAPVVPEPLVAWLVYVAIVTSPLPIATSTVEPEAESSLAAGLTMIGGTIGCPAGVTWVIVTVELNSHPPSDVTGLETIVHDPAGTSAVVVAPAGVGDETLNMNDAPAGRPVPAVSQTFRVPSGSEEFMNEMSVSPDPRITASEPAGLAGSGSGVSIFEPGTSRLDGDTVIPVTAVPGTAPSEAVTFVPARQPVVPFGFVYGPGRS